METGQKVATANEQLARMGYKAELPRNLGMLSILGLWGSSLTEILHREADNGSFPRSFAIMGSLKHVI